MLDNNIDFLKMAEQLYDNQFKNPSISTTIFGINSWLQPRDIIELWMVPLLKILVQYLIFNNQHAEKVYLGERIIRPFRKEITLTQKRDYFETILKMDTEIIYNALCLTYPKCQAALEKLHSQLSNPDAKKEVRITSIGDCVMEQTNTAIATMALANRIQINAFTHYISGYTNTGSFDVLNQPLSTTPKTHIDITAISFFTYWGIPTYRNLMKSLWEKKISDNAANKLVNLIIAHIENYIDNITNHQDTIIFLHNTAGLPWLGSEKKILLPPWSAKGPGNYPQIEHYIQKINSAIDCLITSKKNLFLIDERKIGSTHGLSLCESEIFSPETYDAYKLPIFHYSMLSFFIADDYIKIITDLVSLEKKKVLFIDFDNTLWHGIMTEEKVTHYQEKQRKICELGKRGLVLVALSKNTESLIRWNEMHIAKNDFTLLKINWNNKIDNIKESIHALNLNIDSCILLDDSPEELVIIEEQFPNMLCLNSKYANSWSTIDYLLKINSTTTKESRNRKQLYIDNLSRNNYVNDNTHIKNQHELLSPLKILLQVEKLTENNIERAFELLSRTNQFNCSGKIYTKDELINAIQNNNYIIKTFNLSDRLGDMGIIGAVFMRINQSKSECLIENFVMSCRAIGYGAEEAMLSIAVQATDCHLILGIYKPTSKNTPASTLYPHAGFIEITGTDCWVLDKRKNMPQYPTWIDVRRADPLPEPN